MLQLRISYIFEIIIYNHYRSIANTSQIFQNFKKEKGMGVTAERAKQL